MKNRSERSSRRNAKRPGKLEQTIALGKTTFMEVGLALAEIRDLKLYKHEHASFGEYCRVKWGWTKPQADQLIEVVSGKKSNQLVTLFTLPMPNQGKADSLTGPAMTEKSNQLVTLFTPRRATQRKSPPQTLRGGSKQLQTTASRVVIKNPNNSGISVLGTPKKSNQLVTLLPTN